MPTSILHITTSLGQGGAQAVLFRLVSSLAVDTEIRQTVISLVDDGVYGERLRSRGIQTYTINMARWGSPLGRTARLYKIIRKEQPDIVQTWMYHADLLGGTMARLAGCTRLIWGIRNSTVRKPLTRGIAGVCALLSRWTPTAIACCSDEAARVHQAWGYRPEKFRLIANGYDLALFGPDSDARARVRSEWGVAPQEVLLGMVGRWDAQKDHHNLLHALSGLAAGGRDFRCALVGPGMTHDNAKLCSIVRRFGLEERTMLIGPRSDIPAVMNALDIHVLSSAFGEAFPNVVAESMACATPSVATNVGDAAFMVGNPDWVAPPRDPGALARAIEEVLADLDRDGREGVGNRCRERIQANFSLDRMTKAYRALWDDVMRNPHGSLP